jgi:hypothetical protein
MKTIAELCKNKHNHEHIISNGPSKGKQTTDSLRIWNNHATWPILGVTEKMPISAHKLESVMLLKDERKLKGMNRNIMAHVDNTSMENT